MFALYNYNTKKFFRLENQYRNNHEVNSFIMAKTYKTRKDAEYECTFIKGDYKVITFEEAKELNILY